MRSAAEIGGNAEQMARKFMQISLHAEQTTRHSVETTRHSVETTRHSVETTRHSVETTRHSVEATRHSVEATRHSVEATRHSVESTRPFVGATLHLFRSTLSFVETTLHSFGTTHQPFGTTFPFVRTMRHSFETARHPFNTTGRCVEGSPNVNLADAVWPMEIVVMNRQRRVPVRLAWLRKVAAVALAECRNHSDDGKFALQQLPEVEVTIVSDAVIAKVHIDFMDIPGATDVITFEHGEIVISAETAAMYAREHGHSVNEELALYIVHGLLHLNGYDDTTAAAKKRMFKVQDTIWEHIRAEWGNGR